MKILNLKIIDTKGNLIREIPFNESGLSIVFGEVKEARNLQGTSNSLGKTLLLKMLYYILGSDYSAADFEKGCKGYLLKATVRHKGQTYGVERTVDRECSPEVDGAEMSLIDFKRIFEIDRSEYTHQVSLSKRPGLFSGYSKNMAQSDARAFLELLGFDAVVDYVDTIYAKQDSSKAINDSKKELAKLLGISGSLKQVNPEIEKKIFYNEKEVEKYKKQQQELDEKIKTLDVAEVRQDLQKEYLEKNNHLKGLIGDIELLKIEVGKLQGFLEETCNIEISSKELISLLEKAKQEIPEAAMKSIEEVERFHKKVFDERSATIANQIKLMRETLLEKGYERDVLSQELARVGKVIAENKAFQEALALYQEVNDNLQNALFEKGKYEQLAQLNKQFSKIDDELSTLYLDARENMKQYEKLITKYQEFVFRLSEKIYGNDRDGFFEVKIGEKHALHRPLKLTLDLQGDSGEGVGAAKDAIVDALVFAYNKKIEILIEDSSCYGGMDPRQVHSLIQEVELIAIEEQKQAIISVNRFQIQQADISYSENAHQYYAARSVITLSENDKLLKKDF